MVAESGRWRQGGGSAQGTSMWLESSFWFMGPLPALRHRQLVLLLLHVRNGD